MPLLGRLGDWLLAASAESFRSACKGVPMYKGLTRLNLEPSSSVVAAGLSSFWLRVATCFGSHVPGVLDLWVSRACLCLLGVMV